MICLAFLNTCSQRDHQTCQLQAQPVKKKINLELVRK